MQTNTTCCDMLHRSREQKKCWHVLGKKVYLVSNWRQDMPTSCNSPTWCTNERNMLCQYVAFDLHGLLRPMQTDATLLANNTQHCRAQHVASICMEPQQKLVLVAYSLKPVKLLRPMQTDAASHTIVACC